MKICANLDHLWQDMPLLDRVYVAADKGFEGVEIGFPYEMPAKDLQRCLLSAGVKLVSIAAPPPNYTGGARGFAARPGAEARFRTDLRRALRFADALYVPFVTVLTGQPATGIRTQAEATLQGNLDWAAEESRGTVLLLEPARGTALADFGTAARIVQDVGRDTLRMRFDICEAEALTGSAVKTLSAQTIHPGLVVIADGPVRSPPGRGSIDLHGIGRVLQAQNYAGWLSAAYPFGFKDTGVLDWRSAMFATA